MLKNGFVDIAEKEILSPGDKIFYVNRGRSLYAAVIGTENMEKGFKIVAAHGDSPRIDLKQNPGVYTINIQIGNTFKANSATEYGTFTVSKDLTFNWEYDKDN